MRAWMFSSVTPGARPAKTGLRARSKAPMTSAIGRVSVRMARPSARAWASVTLPALEYGDGMSTPSTFAGPSASAATAATSAESMPPDRPSRARRKPLLAT